MILPGQLVTVAFEPEELTQILNYDVDLGSGIMQAQARTDLQHVLTILTSGCFVSLRGEHGWHACSYH